ncbi:MAG: tRNA (adenosine(37)-N6)-threonylcarbamoyltransferase complex dimerization subunit type 1 TsaB [Chthoniobacterales bacterium]|nr:tRNA (adenosine(37)-N6)-threonylcarbamoyltransferase complex dimerization subunit type 1 TsaB [Chthoniobacterales bacterium]
MSILALEFSSAVGSVAFRGADGSTIVRQFPADRQHSGLFYENLSEVRHGCGLAEIIVVGLGPGSYAGTRIAIATAMGLRAASNARLVGLPSICAFDFPEYCVAGDARRSSYFFAHVEQGRCLEGPSLLTEEELRAKMREHPHLPFVAAERLPRFSEITLGHPSAALLAELAEQADGREENLEPIYLRQPYITTAKAMPWTR